MSVDDQTLNGPAPGPSPDRINFAPPRRGRFGLGRRRPRPPKPRLRKLRFVLILTAFMVLALISTLFGMLTSVASDLPQLENRAQYGHAVNSYLYDVHGTPIGVLAPPDQNHPVIDSWRQINQNMVHAIVSVEDRRFWTDPGIDIRGIARAFLSDFTGGPRQGASTIAEQFVKNALAEQGNRTIFEKLREAALAFQLTHKWKRMKILTEYLNSIYFGNGAFGIESAARVYFGSAHGYNVSAGANQAPGACGDPNAADQSRPECAQVLKPYEAALLAGMVANPSAFNPFAHPKAATGRRNLVLRDMYQQRYITRTQYEDGIHQPLPPTSALQQPQEPPAAPYFTAWVRPQIVDALEREGIPAKIAQYRAFYGGLKIRLTVDLRLQQAAQQTIDSEFPTGSGLPTASLVAIDNKTGEVRAMVSGNGDYSQMPFNLATLGYRQPGSSFKPFTLAAALATGEYGPSSIIDSAPQHIPDPQGHDCFCVHNFGNTYSGPITLAEATAISDNTVFAQVGVHVGPGRIAKLARRMGIRTPVSSNDAMILGGLSHGVSPLDMAHAYETFATGGLKVFDHALGDGGGGPIGIHSIHCPVCEDQNLVNRPTYQRILSAPVAATVHELLTRVVSPGGTAPLAAIPGVDVVGKTGTTSNYVDAWFVGWTPQMTTAVWVGYPTKSIPMTTAYNGQPVEGGTYPAIIWHNFMVQGLQILAAEQAAAHPGQTTTTTTPLITGTPVYGAGSTTPTTATAGTTPTTGATTSATTTPTTGAASTPATTTTTPGGGTAGTGTTPAGTATGGGTGTTGGTSTGTGGAGVGGPGG